jgi:hypothetical protein
MDIEKTHNIVFLLSKCADFDSAFTVIDPLNINAYAVQGRYPDTNLMPEKEEAQAYYKLAMDVKNLVKEKIIF